MLYGGYDHAHDMKIKTIHEDKKARLIEYHHLRFIYMFHDD